MGNQEFGRLWVQYVDAMAACLLQLRTKGENGSAADRLVSSELFRAWLACRVVIAAPKFQDLLVDSKHDLTLHLRAGPEMAAA